MIYWVIERRWTTYHVYTWLTAGYQNKFTNNGWKDFTGNQGDHYNMETTVINDLRGLEFSWDEVPAAAEDRQTGRQRVTRCVRDVGWIKLKVKDLNAWVVTVFAQFTTERPDTLQCMGRPFPLKIAPSHGDLDPSYTRFPEPTRVHNPNGISIGSAVFAGLTIMRDRQAVQTDQAFPSVTIDRIYVRSITMRPDNNNNDNNNNGAEISKFTRWQVLYHRLWFPYPKNSWSKFIDDEPMRRNSVTAAPPYRTTTVTDRRAPNHSSHILSARCYHHVIPTQPRLKDVITIRRECRNEYLIIAGLCADVPEISDGHATLLCVYQYVLLYTRL